MGAPEGKGASSESVPPASPAVGTVQQRRVLLRLGEAWTNVTVGGTGGAASAPPSGGDMDASNEESTEESDSSLGPPLELPPKPEDALEPAPHAPMAPVAAATAIADTSRAREPVEALKPSASIPPIVA